MRTNTLEVNNISKIYGHKVVLDDLSFSVKKGEFLSLLGPSGCGKTTLLRILMGMVRPDTGSIKMNGNEIIDLPPSKRNMGMVFQNYALFPNMSVYQNIAYALKVRKFTKEEIDKKVKNIISMVGLSEHIYKKPYQLSGGQQQRVALARTLVLEPEIILFDEPMSALDSDIKMVLRKLIKDLQYQLNITMIFVTHDQEEAFALSDRIMVISQSKIIQLDEPKKIYAHPIDDYVKTSIVDRLDEKVRSIEASIR